MSQQHVQSGILQSSGGIIDELYGVQATPFIEHGESVESSFSTSSFFWEDWSFLRFYLPSPHQLVLFIYCTMFVMLMFLFLLTSDVDETPSYEARIIKEEHDRLIFGGARRSSIDRNSISNDRNSSIGIKGNGGGITGNGGGMHIGGRNTTSETGNMNLVTIGRRWYRHKERLEAEIRNDSRGMQLSGTRIPRYEKSFRIDDHIRESDKFAKFY